MEASARGDPDAFGTEKVTNTVNPEPNQSPDRTAARRGFCQRALAVGRQIVGWRFWDLGGCRSAHR
jgi:hypothetical protein